MCIRDSYVAFSWSDYFTSFLHKVNIHIPDYLTCSYMEAKKAFDNNSSNAELTNAWSNAPLLGSLKIIFDLPALVINVLITTLVYIGVKESRNFSNIMVILKLIIVALVIAVGAYYVDPGNWAPVN